jgi:lipopolysaccharide export system permease protein
MCIFGALVFLGDTVEKMRWINSYQASMGVILKYSLLTTPSWLMQILPVACLLSALLVVSDMISSGEWTACLAGGFAAREIFKPILACVALIALAGFLAQEFIVPDLSKRAKLTLQHEIRGQDDYRPDVQKNITLRLDDKNILFARELRPQEGLMQDMFIDVYGDGKSLVSQISAKRFVWSPEAKAWLFWDGVLRSFGKNASIKEKEFKSMQSAFFVPPSKIAAGSADDAYSMTVFELLRRVKFLKISGLSSFKERTFLQTKLAAPFATLIVCLLGMPLAIAAKLSSKLINVISAVAVGFAFWWTASLLSSAGQSGMLNPVVAGWLPVLAFAVVVYAEFKILKI